MQPVYGPFWPVLQREGQLLPAYAPRDAHEEAQHGLEQGAEVSLRAPGHIIAQGHIPQL